MSEGLSPLMRLELEALITAARREDLGPHGVDVTSAAILPLGLRGAATLRCRGQGVLAGAEALPLIAQAYDPAIELRLGPRDGDRLAPGAVVATYQGPLASLLAMERVALNLLSHLSGIASLTARHVEAVRGTKASICDTRKTLPGLRSLQKHAVACGGGVNHRHGLHDAMLVKDNHLAHLAPTQLGPALRDGIARARADALRRGSPLAFVEVEVDKLDQFSQVIDLDVDIVLLDNLPPEAMRRAVELRDRHRPSLLLEASGGVNLTNVRAVAEAGVDRISIGALTHSAPALDLGLDID